MTTEKTIDNGVTTLDKKARRLREEYRSLCAESESRQRDAEQLIAVVKAAPDEIEAARGRFHQSFGEADDDAMKSAKADIKRRNTERDAAIAKLKKMVEPLRQLLQAKEILYGAACEIVVAREKDTELARDRFAKARGDLDCASTLGGSITTTLRDVRGVVEPRGEAKPTPVPRPVGPSQSNTPACPRCLRNDNVTSDGAGRWRCSAAYHGPLKFNRHGEETRKAVAGRV